MKQKVLLAGSQDAIFDDFFMHTENVYTCLTSSNRSADIKEHINVFEPDIFVYCLGGDFSADNETIELVVKSLDRAEYSETVFALIGDKYHYEGLREDLLEKVDLQLIKPISIKRIQTEIEEVIEKKKIEKEQRERELQRLAAEAEANRKRHILIVDDDPTTLRTIKMYLDEKYSVATAPSGKFALKFLSQRPTDLILLDYEMPEMSGPEVFQQIKEDEKMSKIPVVFLTGITDTNKIKEVLAMLPQGYLLKPVDYDLLHQTVANVLGL